MTPQAKLGQILYVNINELCPLEYLQIFIVTENAGISPVGMKNLLCVCVCVCALPVCHTKADWRDHDFCHIILTLALPVGSEVARE